MIIKELLHSVIKVTTELKLLANLYYSKFFFFFENYNSKLQYQNAVMN